MRRRAVLLFLVVAAALGFGSGVALAAVINGNGNDNTLTGTRQPDRINGRGGSGGTRSLPRAVSISMCFNGSPT